MNSISFLNKVSCLFLCWLCTFNVLAQQPKLYINELVALPHQMMKDGRGEYDDWVEIYNAEDTAICLAGYYLTDDLSNPTKAKIDDRFKQFTTVAPKGYVIFWLDKGTKTRPPIHVELKLSGSGEQVGLFSPKGELIDSVTFGEQQPNLSYARIGDGSPTWGFASKATPKASNSREVVQFVSPPGFSLSGGLYEGTITIKLSASDQKDTLYYTLDGSSPNRSAGIQYTTPISLDSTTVVRAIAVNGNGVTGKPVTHTYFFNTPPFSLPVISLTTDSIATLKRTDAGSGYTGENEVHLEFFTSKDKQAAFRLDAGFRLVGAAIRYYPQKSIAIRTRVEYGSEYLDYPLFDQKPHITKYHDFLLRNSGNDNTRTLFRDALMHSLVSENMDMDYLAYQPAVLYVNGQYWGIQNIREKVSRYYLEANHPKVSKDKDVLEWQARPIQGDQEHYDLMDQFARSRDLSIQANYDTMASWMDIDNFIDYFITETFYGNTDWPMANIKYWRPRNRDGKWRWILFDTDLSFDLQKNRCRGHHNSIQYVLNHNNCHLPHLDHALQESTALFRALLENESFKKQFLSRYADLLNTNFRSDHVVATIQQFHDRLAPEMPRHIKRWGKERGINSMKRWESEVAHLRRFAAQRPDTIRHFLTEAFDLGEPVELVIAVSDSSAGQVKVNTITPAHYPFTCTYFRKLEVEIVAKPTTGYRFKHWQESGATNAKITLKPTETTLTAVFEKI